MGIGRREDPSSRWIFVPLIIIAIVFAWLPPHLDHLDRWSIDGDVVRYMGLIIAAIGGFVRVATVFELGHRFSIFVALQPDHRLKTDGFTSSFGTRVISERYWRWLVGRLSFEASSVCS